MSKTVRFQGGPVQDSNQDFNQDHQVILALCSLCFAIPTNSEFSTSPLSRCARSGLHAQVDWDFTLRAPRNRRKTCTLLGPWTLLPLLVIEGLDKQGSERREGVRAVTKAGSSERERRRHSKRFRVRRELCLRGLDCRKAPVGLARKRFVDKGPHLSALTRWPPRFGP